MKTNRNTTLRLLRILLHTFSLLPILVLVVAYLTNNLTVNPIQAATQRTGDVAVILLLLSLSCSPLSNLTGFSAFLKFRRPLGLYSFAYAITHMLLFTWVDFGLEMRYLLPEFLEKRYLWVGLPAFLILLTLALTSFKQSMRALGKNWKRLHRLVYLALLLVSLHVAWAVKGDLFNLSGDVWKPLAVASTGLILLLLRIPPVSRFLKNRLSRNINLSQTGT